MLPAKEVLLPNVAELPICQKTPVSDIASSTSIIAALDVVSAVPIWKTNNAFALCSVFSVSVPVNCAELAKW